MAGSWSNTSITSLTIPTGATTGERIVIDGVTGTITAYFPDNNIAWQESASNGQGLIISFSDDPPISQSACSMENGLFELYWEYATPDVSRIQQAIQAADGTYLITSLDETGLQGDMACVPTAFDMAWTPFNESWQQPSYNTNWSGSTTFGTLTGLQSLQFRVTAEDELLIGGCWVAGATLPGSAVFQLPAGYRPLAAYPVDITKNAAGTITTTKGYISTAGNLNLNAQFGSSATAGAFYAIAPTCIPLGSLT